MLDLPGAMPLPDDHVPVDLHIHLNPPAPLRTGAPLYRREEDALVFSPPGVGTYRITDRDLAITPVGGADVAALLIATAVPAWLWLRRRLVLHAAAVVMPGATHALVIGGATGSGKSTMLAALLARDAAMLSDDTVAVDFEGAVPWSSGLAGGYWRAVPLEGRVIQAVPAGCAVRRAPIGAIVLLDRGAGAPWFERLAPLAAMPELLASRHRPAVPRLLRRDAAVLAQCAGLASAVPIYRWHRTDGVPSLSDAELGALHGMTD